MATIYFIGGPPRVGKTRLSLLAIGRQPMFGISTDTLRAVMRTAYTEAQKPALYATEYEPLGLSIAERIDRQNAESREVWPAVQAFVQEMQAQGHDAPVEGVAVLPEFLATLSVPYKVIFVGNTEAGYVTALKHHARLNPHDWLHSYDDAGIERFANFATAFSAFIRDEAKARGLPYLALRHDGFEQSQRQALDALFASQ